MRKFAIIASILAFLVSCKNDPKAPANDQNAAATQQAAPAGDLKIDYIVKKEGAPKVKDNEYCYYHIKITAGDKLISDSRNITPEPLKIQVPVDNKADALVTALRTMSVGEKVIVHYPLTEEHRKNYNLGDTKEALYEVELVAIKSVQEYVKDIKEEAKKLSATRAIPTLPKTNEKTKKK